MSQKIKKIKEYILSKDESYKIWEELGVFEDVPIEDAIAMSEKLNELAIYLSHGFVSVNNLLSDTLIFAIVIRAYKKYNYIFKSCQLVLNHINVHQHMIAELSVNADGEAEFCAQMAEEISNLKL